MDIAAQAMGLLGKWYNSCPEAIQTVLTDFRIVAPFLGIGGIFAYFKRANRHLREDAELHPERQAQRRR